MVRKTTSTAFPAARIKRIMQMDEEVGKVAQAAPILMSKALERFLKELITGGVEEAKTRSAKKLTASHLKKTIVDTQSMDFLKDLVESVPDLAEPSAAPKRKRRKANTDENGGADGEQPKKTKGAGGGGKRKKAAPKEEKKDAKDEKNEKDDTDKMKVEESKPVTSTKKEDDEDYDDEDEQDTKKEEDDVKEENEAQKPGGRAQDEMDEDYSD